MAEGAFFVLAPLAHLQKLVLGLFEWLFAHFLQVFFWAWVWCVDGAGVIEVDLFGGGDEGLLHHGLFFEIDPL